MTVSPEALMTAELEAGFPPALFESLPVGIAVFDYDLVLQHCNPAWAEFIARATSSSASRVAPEVSLVDLAPGVAVEALSSRDRILAGETIRLEGPPFERDGGLAAWDLIWSPFRRDGGVSGIVGIAVEVGSRACEECLTRVVESAASGLVLFDLEGRITFANAAAERILGLSQSEIRGRRYDDPAWEITAAGGGRFPKTALPFARVLATGASVSGIEYAIERPDGRRVFLSAHAAPLRDSANNVTAVVAALSDVTERAEAYRLLEQRVADRTRELSALYEVTAAASSSLELDTVLAHSLDQILSVMSCWTGGIWLGNGPGSSLHLAASRGISSPPDALPEQLPQVDTWSRRVVELGEPLVVPKVQPVSPSGARSAERSRDRRSRGGGAEVAGACQVYVGVPMRVRGRVLGALGVLGAPGQQFSLEEIALLNSIADQVAIAVENARLYRQAQQLAVVKERARLARELHDSVTQWLYSVTLFADTVSRMIEADEPESVPEYLGHLGSAARQALREMRLLVHELRPLALEQEGLVGALHHRLNAVEKRAGLETRLLVEGKVELPPQVEEALYQIAREALNNSLKHALASQIVLRLRAADGAVEMTISDDGQGFDPRVAVENGGLGLTTMRERAEGLGGALSIRSAPGRGTTVVVRLESVKTATASLRSTQYAPRNTESGSP